MATTLRVYDRAGTRLGRLPWSDLSRTIVCNGPGTLTTTVPLSVLTSGLLADERYLRVVEDGVEAPDFYLLDEDGDDAADGGGDARPVAIGATGVVNILEWAEVYPMQHVAGGSVLGLKATYEFGNATPGKIMGDLITKAKARGVFPHLTTSFTAALDSAGQPWPATYSRVYDVGATLLSVLQTMADDVWVDYEMTGFRLDLYAPGTALAADHPEVILRLGRGVKSGPRKRTRKTLRSVLLAAGSEGAMVEQVDPDALAALGRREGYEGRSGVTDYGTLTATTAISLSRLTSASESLTLDLEPSVSPVLPRPGGFLRYDQRRLTTTEYEPLRVQSIAWSYGSQATLSVELADLWVDRDVRNGRRIDALLGGSSANERVPLPPSGSDTIAPTTPQGLSLTSAGYLDRSGQTFAQVTATWLQVTIDGDGTVCDDLIGYQIEYRQLDAQPGSSYVDVRITTLATWSPVVPATTIDVRIRSVDRFNNTSPWSGWTSIITGDDTTPPPTPSTPLVDNYLGLLRVRWDGKAPGAVMPADLDELRVHTSTVAGFTPTVDTLAGTMTAAGSVFVRTTYGQTVYARLVAVDRTGNASPASVQASGTSSAVVAADVFDGAIGSSKLADLAVTTAKINTLAVNTAQIGELSVGKLSAGTMVVDVVMGGRIATALTGQRVELNSLGIYRWDAAGNQTVAIDGNGTLLTGVFRTALSGRRIEIGAGGLVGEMKFYAPDGRVGTIRSYTEGTGLEATQIVAAGGASYINLNSMNYTSYRANIHEFQAVGAGNKMRWFFDPSGTQGFVEMTGGGGSISPQLKFTCPTGLTVALRVVADGSSQQFDVTNGDQNVWYSIRASQFLAQSDAEVKTSIRSVSRSDALTDVMGMPVKRYRRKAHGPHGREQVGFIAQDLPDRVVSAPDPEGGRFVDVYQLLALTVGAVQKLKDEIDEMRSATR